MGYLYENSNPERFQQFCQSLLTSSFPKLQCYPIGQPDGGRDGWDPETKTVLQVKFRRSDEDESAEWIIGALEKELPKIIRLAERGAENYIIATNARGTAHLDGGRIDKVQTWLSANVPIPATCLWRDDVDRRLVDASASLKLKYSELFSLDDGIEVALAAVLGMGNERKRDVMQAFIAAQFDADQTVKFKQVSLSNDLLDLFIDVPVGFVHKTVDSVGRQSSSTQDEYRKIRSAFLGSDHAFYVNEETDGGETYIGRASGETRPLKVGAAELLLSDAAQNHIKLVMLEGAPGQGKSTLAQYVCQVHRVRYLKKTDLIERIPDLYKQTALRVPIKVDLRDYAAFLDGNSPFSSNAASSEPRSLDVFLAQQIAYISGGLEFKPLDVLSVLKEAPVLLFLDGLDEVADLASRKTLVASIREALARWQEFEADLQVVVTSRPSVFGGAPNFGKFGFITLNLRSIDSARINEYAEKWVVARGLGQSEVRDVKKILAEKLELAHIRELTRNLMQLTILLSLIHQIGHSLPDQRTDLYSRYVDLFLTREADKSVRVRENRQVLLGFIQYLAWFLQVQAESSKSAGSISEIELQDLAREYLRAGDQSVTIADDLFGGGLERIFVLVERIEGLYEFEVQPLREFYCAQYLYTSAPVGTYRHKELCGDRAQRFEALAASPFWLNVCRFYAGSCERGEAATLVASLEEMIQTGDLTVSNHARRVGLALLQDWVFSNVKWTQDKLIRAVLAGTGTQMLLLGERSTEELRLDVACGRNTLRDVVFEELKTWPVDIRTSLLCNVLRINGGADLGEQFCDLLAGTAGEQRTYQLIRMFRSGAAMSMVPERLWNLVVEDQPDRAQLLRRITVLVQMESALALRIPELVTEFVAGVLDGGIIDGIHQLSPLGAFADILGSSLGRYGGLRHLEFVNSHTEDWDLAPESVREFLSVISGSAFRGGDIPLDDRTASEAWGPIVECARSTFGETWSTMSMAIRIAGIRRPIDSPEGVDRLFDTTVPLCDRARAARLRRGGVKWWLEQLEQASTDLDRRLWVGLAVMWSSVSNLYSLSGEIDAIVGSLGDHEFGALCDTLSLASAGRELRADRKSLSRIDLQPFSAKTAVLVAHAFRAPLSSLLYGSRQGRTEPLRAFLSLQEKSEEIESPPPWKNVDETLLWASKVNHLRNLGTLGIHRVLRHMYEGRLQADLIDALLSEPTDYPLELVSRALIEAQRRYRPKTLSAVSAEQRWVFA